MINKKTIEDLLYKTTPILVVLAVLVHTNNILGYMGFGPDNIVQSVTALSLMEGQGLSIPFANPDDLSESTYEPFGRFLGPGARNLPGYGQAQSLAQNQWQPSSRHFV